MENTDDKRADMETAEKSYPVLDVEEDNNKHGGLVENYISYLPTVYFGWTLQACWEAVGLTLQLNLLNGGTATLVYGGLLTSVGCILIALSLAEMASADPAVGAQYRWSARFAPFAPRFWGLFQGWITVFAWMTSTAASLAYLAQSLLSIVVLWFPGFEVAPWQNALVMAAFCVPPLVANLWFRRIVVAMEWIGALGHGIFWVASIAVLSALSTRSSHAAVWASLTTGESGWAQPGVAFGIGVLPLAFPTTGFDGIIHMSTEVKEAKRNVPAAIILSVVLNCFMMFPWLVVAAYYLGDLDALAEAPLGVALVGLYMNATKSKAATTFLVMCHAFILYVSLANIFASVARLTWAFAQNDGLPYSKYIGQVSDRFKQPLRALLLLTTVCVILCMISIGSTTAFNAMISIPLIGLYISYGIPIAFLLTLRLRNRLPELGPFRLGSYGTIINALAVSYILYILSFAALPTVLPATSDNMNYAGPLVLAVMLAAAADWFVSGRHRFKLPKTAPTMQ
ncbi:amino acid/polyamine transporter I [Pestalotiopsis sp. NC0098]|nr:amino acid/polyamine transporter I [Pestalotiopsis sp. NC0098]